MELIFPIYLYRKLEKIFLSETTGPISIYLGKNVSLVTLSQDCSSYHDLSKNMAGRGRGLFSPYIYIENFNDLLVRNHWTGLIFPIYIEKLVKVFFSETTGPISLQLGKNVSLVTLYQDCSSNHDLSKNMAASG